MKKIASSCTVPIVNSSRFYTLPFSLYLIDSPVLGRVRQLLSKTQLTRVHVVVLESMTITRSLEFVAVHTVALSYPAEKCNTTPLGNGQVFDRLRAHRYCQVHQLQRAWPGVYFQGCDRDLKVRRPGSGWP
jgi:hypothetical protein